MQAQFYTVLSDLETAKNTAEIVPSHVGQPYQAAERKLRTLRTIERHNKLYFNNVKRGFLGAQKTALSAIAFTAIRNDHLGPVFVPFKLCCVLEKPCRSLH